MASVNRVPVAALARRDNPAMHRLKDWPSAGHLARVLGVPTRTARRWKAAGRLPAPWLLLFLLLGERDLGALDEAWRGWRLARGEIVSPEGLAFRPGEVLAASIRMQQLAELERQLREPQQWNLLPAAAEAAVRAPGRDPLAFPAHR